jgi:hypothetical protein
MAYLHIFLILAKVVEETVGAKNGMSLRRGTSV